MVGIFGYFTPVSAEVGVNRSLSMNPKIINTRGYLDHNKTLDDYGMDNLYGIGELLNIYTATHADPMRINIQKSADNL